MNIKKQIIMTVFCYGILVLSIVLFNKFTNPLSFSLMIMVGLLCACVSAYCGVSCSVSDEKNASLTTN